MATRAETFPFPETRYDFWPAPAAGALFVLGLRSDGGGEGRSPEATQNIELVAGYLAAAAGPKSLRSPALQPL